MKLTSILINYSNPRLRLLFAIIFLINSSNAFAQETDKTWLQLTDNKGKTFEEVCKNFDNFCKEQNLKKGEGVKVFKRWMNYMEPRVFPSGNMTLPTTTYSNYLDWQTQKNKQSKNSRISSVTTSTSNWTELGPLSKPSGYDSGVGRIDIVRFDPTDSNIMYVCSPDGGLWKSVDGGANWTTNTDFLPIIGCADLVINPSNNQNMYLATGSRENDRASIGILKSLDGGSTWETTSVVIPPGNGWNIRKLIMDPSNPLVMIAVLNVGIMRTTDGWATYTEPTLSGNIELDDVEFKPGNSNVVYASGKDFYKSTDNGVVWTKIVSNLPIPTEVSRALVSVTAANSDYVYLVYGNDTGGYLGTYRSVDGGDNFTARSTFTTLDNNILNCDTISTSLQGQASHNLAMVISPTDPEIVTIGGCNIWQSKDGGTTWSLTGYWLGNDVNYPGVGELHPDYVHADIQSLEYLPGSSTTLFVTCDGGISKSINNGGNWVDISNNLRVSQMTNVGQSALTPLNMITGLQDIGTLKNTNGVWSVTNGGDGEDGFIDRTNDDVIVTSNPNGAYALSLDGGVTRVNITGLPAGSEFFSPIHQDPVSANVVYAGGREALYKSTAVLTDPADTWTMLGTPAGTGGIIRFEIAPSNNQVIYVIKGNNLSKSIDGGASFTDITGTLPTNLAQLTNLTISNTDANKVWVTFSGYATGQKVFKTTNSGSVWINISTGLPNIPMNTIVYVNNSTNEGIYLGADIGVYYMDNVTSWTPFFTGLPNSHVNDLEIYYPTQKIRAATYGRGLWESDLFIVCVKPNAGTDQSPLCVGNTPITTATLAATAVSGGMWTQASGNPSGASITSASSASSGITGLTPGTFNFIWSTSSTCRDTVKITIPNCVCVKPNAGTDQSPLCVGNTPITTATLAATAVSGGMWTQASGNPSGVSITSASSANSGITGLTPGTFNFIWSTSSTCSDTVKITIPNCVLPGNKSIAGYIWIDDNNNGFQDEALTAGLKNVIVELYQNGSTVLYKKDTTDNSGNYSFDALPNGDYQVKVLSSSLPLNHVISPIFSNGSDGSKNSDIYPLTSLSAIVSISNSQVSFKIDAAIYRPKVDINKSISMNSVLNIGDTISITINVLNNLDSLLRDINIIDMLPSGLSYLSSSATVGAYNNNTHQWQITSIPVAGKVTLTLKGLITQGGVFTNTAIYQNDSVAICYSVAIPLCKEKGETVLLSAPSGYTTYQWYKDDIALVGEVGSTYTANSSGSYSVKVNNNICPTTGCCPTIIVEKCFCPTMICIPITVKKVR
jgi:uncharacterized repeat protein (TIGR01451 family)